MRREFLKKAIDEKGFTVLDLAKKLGVSRVFIQFLISGKQNASPELAQRIANEVGVNPCLLVKEPHRCPICAKPISPKRLSKLQGED